MVFYRNNSDTCYPGKSDHTQNNALQHVEYLAESFHAIWCDTPVHRI